MEKLTLPATLDKFEEMMSFVREQASKAGFEAAIVNKIALAAEEVLANVINYAYPDGGGDLTIETGLSSDNRNFVMTLVDSGNPFDPLNHEDPDINAPVEERSIGGLGIFMVKKIMDDVQYRREGDRNILVMEKKLDVKE